jgi:hypothetical protein
MSQASYDDQKQVISRKTLDPCHSSRIMAVFCHD